MSLASSRGIRRPDGHTMLWRYLDITKYIAALDQKALFFCRADRFEDVYEGTELFLFPDGRSVNARLGIPAGGPTTFASRAISTGSAKLRQFFVSSWHAQAHESAAMWKTYVQAGQGAAIVTRAERLLPILDAHRADNVWLGHVKYVEYGQYSAEIAGLPRSLYYKMKSFDADHEVRAVLHRPAVNPGAEGIDVPADPSQLIEHVVLAPGTRPWVAHLIERVTRRYRYTFPVVPSRIHYRPRSP